MSSCTASSLSTPTLPNAPHPFPARSCCILPAFASAASTKGFENLCLVERVRATDCRYARLSNLGRAAPSPGCCGRRVSRSMRCCTGGISTFPPCRPYSPSNDLFFPSSSSSSSSSDRRPRPYPALGCAVRCAPRTSVRARDSRFPPPSPNIIRRLPPLALAISASCLGADWPPLTRTGPHGSIGA
eukprot:3455493-Rhodomonas_salina.1